MTVPHDPPSDRPCPLEQQAVGWALHALEPDEEMAVLLHLPQCPECQAAVHDAERVLAGLGASLERVDPPPALRDALLARVAETPQDDSIPQARGGTDSMAPTEPTRARRHRLDAETPPSERRWLGGRWLGRRGRQVVAASLAAAAVIAVGGLAVRAGQLEQQRDAETAQAQGLSDLISQLGRPGAAHALLAADENSPTVAAVLLVDGQRQVYTVGLPANSTDRDIYVLWGIVAGPGAVPVPLGTFDVAAADQGVRTVGSVAEAEEFAQYAVSIEPGRVAPATPTTVVASGAVAT